MPLSASILFASIELLPSEPKLMKLKKKCKDLPPLASFVPHYEQIPGLLPSRTFEQKLSSQLEH
jgi:hypothetical protein